MEQIIYSFSEIDLPCSEERALLFFKNIQDYPGRVSYSKSLNILKKTKNGLYKEMEVVLPDGKNYYSRSVVRFFHNSFRIRQVFGEIKNLSWRLSVYPLADGQCHVVSTHRFDHSNLKRWPKLTEMIKDIEEKLLRTAYEKINEANQEIVITGLGIITNQGAGKNLLLEGAKNYLSQKNKIFTAYSPHFDPSQILPLKYIGRTDRSNQLALAAVKEALEQSKLKNYFPEEVGIIVCNFLCGINYVEKQSRILSEEGPQNISKYLSLAFFPCGTAGMISLVHQMKGYSATLGGIEHSADQAIQLAVETLKKGKAQYLLVGATEAPLIDLFRKAYAQKYSSEQAEYLSEASCFFILEKKQTALERQAPILAEFQSLKPSTEDPKIHALRYLLCGDTLSCNQWIEYALKILKVADLFDKTIRLDDFAEKIHEVKKDAVF